MRKTWIMAVTLVAAGLVAVGAGQSDKSAVGKKALRAEYKQLADICGVFDVTLKIHPAQPGTEVVVLKGVATREMVLGGKFMQEQLECKDGPTPFSSMSYMGFNAEAKDGPRFEVVRMSSTVNAQMPESGTYDPSRKIYTLKGQHEINGMYENIRNEIKVADPAHQVVETYLSFEGYTEALKDTKVPEYHALTMEYTRR